MARSIDGGASFQNFKISETPFAPVSSIFFGDYNNLAVYKGIIRPIWTRLDAGQLSVWTALVDSTLIPGVVTGIDNPDLTVEKVSAYPNPFTNNSFVSFKLRRPGVVSVDIFDVNGKLVATPIRNKHYPSGKFIERIDSHASRIAPGSYFYRIIINDRLYTQEMVLIE
jgi:hypothetical protein